MSRIIVGLIGVILVGAALTTWHQIAADGTWEMATAEFLALVLTLVTVIIYTASTHRTSAVTSAKWQRESVLGTVYDMRMADRDPAQRDPRTVCGFNNPSSLIVFGKVRCHLMVYGQPADFHPDFDGRNTWDVFPNERSQCWFEIDGALTLHGKTIADMIGERTDANRERQLTMDLEVEMRDEIGNRRVLPSRHYFFDFQEWRWVPRFTHPATW